MAERTGEEDAFGLHVLVEEALQRAHVALDQVLGLLGQLRLHLLLEPPQEERAQHLVQTADDEQRLLGGQLDLLACIG